MYVPFDFVAHFAVARQASIIAAALGDCPADCDKQQQNPEAAHFVGCPFSPMW
jgi:hypothetical protein